MVHCPDVSVVPCLSADLNHSEARGPEERADPTYFFVGVQLSIGITLKVSGWLVRHGWTRWFEALGGPAPRRRGGGLVA